MMVVVVVVVLDGGLIGRGWCCWSRLWWESEEEWSGRRVVVRRIDSAVVVRDSVPGGFRAIGIGRVRNPSEYGWGVESMVKEVVKERRGGDIF